jgi:hypothetical protein
LPHVGNSHDCGRRKEIRFRSIGGEHAQVNGLDGALRYALLLVFSALCLPILISR